MEAMFPGHFICLVQVFQAAARSQSSHGGRGIVRFGDRLATLPQDTIAGLQSHAGSEEIDNSQRSLLLLLCCSGLRKQDGQCVFLEFIPQFPHVNGGIAQLVERLVRNEKVRGSNPLTSTPCWIGTQRRMLWRYGYAACKNQRSTRKDNGRVD